MSYIQECEKIVTNDVFIKLILTLSNGKDLQYVHKLSMKYILVVETEMQNVRKAAESFSLTTEKAVCYNCPNISYVGKTIIIVNNVFDKSCCVEPTRWKVLTATEYKSRMML